MDSTTAQSQQLGDGGGQTAGLQVDEMNLACRCGIAATDENERCSDFFVHLVRYICTLLLMAPLTGARRDALLLPALQF